MSVLLRGSKYKCPVCSSSDFETSTTCWTCSACKQTFVCSGGIPKLFSEQALGEQDRKLRDSFYDGLFGRFYQFMMPFIVMPVRPWAIAKLHWAAFGALLTSLVVLAGLLAGSLWGLRNPVLAVVIAAILSAFVLFFMRQRYIWWLVVLALPTRLSLAWSKFKPDESFASVHARVQEPLKASGQRLQVLDVSTGSCNSLYRHGWMSLDADYTAIDLSETMLQQGAAMMSSNGVAVDLVIGDAMVLPFQDETFDVVLSYGAVNGLTDPVQAIGEMARVAKANGTLLFLDEQLYPAATRVERAYFERVLSSHNVIHHCPVEAMPSSLMDIKVSQIWEFYYICTARKRPGEVDRSTSQTFAA